MTYSFPRLPRSPAVSDDFDVGLRLAILVFLGVFFMSIGFGVDSMSLVAWGLGWFLLAMIIAALNKKFSRAPVLPYVPVIQNHLVEMDDEELADDGQSMDDFLAEMEQRRQYKRYLREPPQRSEPRPMEMSDLSVQNEELI